MILDQLKKLKLLYVEDEDSTREQYVKTFELIFNETFATSNFEEAINLYKKFRPDLIIIDIDLKDEFNGFDIAAKIRDEDLVTKIIFLTAYNDKNYLHRAINSNINGYIIKPLSLDKLIDTIQSSLRELLDISIIKISENLVYNFNTYELLNNNKKVLLGNKENKLLFLLLKNKNKTLRRDEIEYEIWNETFVSNSAVKNLIANLRKKIGKNKIINVSKMGWRIEID